MRLLAALLLTPLAAFAAQGWPTDLEAAKKQAAAEKKDILVLFTGSDWCVWSQRLDREVFDTVEFGAQKRFVLVQADFPRTTPILPALETRNRKLKEEWGVTGFPTVILATAEGVPYARTAYRPGGPEVFVEYLTFLSGRNSTEGIAIYRETPVQKEAREEAYKARLMELYDAKDFDGACRLIDAHFVHDDNGFVLTPYNKAVYSRAFDPENKARALAFIDEAIARAGRHSDPRVAMMFRMKRAEIARGE